MATRKKRSFGGLRKLTSGRWQANYTAPDGMIYKAPRTFAAEDDAVGWLNAERRLIDLDVWTSPEAREQEAEAAEAKSVTLAAYADQWIVHRHIKDSTRSMYRGVFDRHIKETIGAQPIAEITAEDVRAWFTALRATPGHRRGDTGETRNARVYALLQTILGTAADDGLIPTNPCRIPRAGLVERKHEIKVLTATELDALAEAMPERLCLLVTLAAWCGLRRGELLELRRSDLAADGSTVHIRRAVVFVKGEAVVSTPKSAAGTRKVAVPRHIAEAVVEHLDAYVGKAKNALVFAETDGGRAEQWTLRRAFRKATGTIGKPDTRLHDLRHTGAVLAAQAGATTKELMARMGHTTPDMAMRYQHVADGRDAEIARRMSEMALGR